MAAKSGKPWGGRFCEPTDPKVEQFTTSIDVDRRLYRHDIEGSIAHARMLHRQRLLTDKELQAIIDGLREIRTAIESNTFEFRPGDEDIHMAIERALIERIGEAGKKLHTGRSRNDQVALDLRMYVREEARATLALLTRLKSILVDLAMREKETIIPGYTHLQQAQPILLAHYFLAYEAMFSRDEERMVDFIKRVNVMPLGTGALAGSGLPLDREYVAKLLDFPSVTTNSLDTVADRDFVVEFIFVASVIMMHMSRLCEDLIIWSTAEFGFVELADGFATGSSLMPQKKNPDVPELIRGKTGRVYGHLMAILTILKGLPMTYNRDLQEDKAVLFDTVDTVHASLAILGPLLTHLTVNRVRMAEEAERGYATATDIVEYLVEKGVPFREAHNVVGKLVAYGIENKKGFGEMSVGEFRAFHPAFDHDVTTVLSARTSIERKKTVGGTSPASVEKQINTTRNRGTCDIS